MLKRIPALVAMAALATACASAPGEVSGPAGSTAGAIDLPTTSATVSNMAGYTSWISEERLLPQNPILAMIATGGSSSSPAGFAVTCNPDNGKLTARLGLQPVAKVGKSESYRLRLGSRADRINGDFEASATSGYSDFVFEMETAALRQMSTLESSAFVDAAGVTQWAFVTDPASTVNANYVGSLANMDRATQDFLIFCNPK